jgi:hypothetical protein
LVDATVKIGEAAAVSGASPRALRLYEDEGQPRHSLSARVLGATKICLRGA